MDVGFIGLGNVGRPMAINLLKAGHRVTVFNRTRERAQSLEPDGALVAASVADACAHDVVITVVADDDALEDIVYRPDGVVASLGSGAIHVCMSTISRALAERLAQDHTKAGQHYVSAPFFGRPNFAEAGKLLVVAAGPATAIEHCMPLFDAVGRRTLDFGAVASIANVVKLSGNILIALAIQGMAETFALVRKSGGDPAAYSAMINEALPAPQYAAFGAIMANGTYDPPGFRLELGLKDVDLALQAADSVGVPMPATSLVREMHRAAIARGYGGLDWGALGKLAADMAGET